MATKTVYDPSVKMKRGEMPKFALGEIIVDWTKNTSKACLYTLDGEPCCYSEDDVWDLVDAASETSILNVGLQQPLMVYINAHGRPVLVGGYRRYRALRLLEARGQLNEVPVVHGKGSPDGFFVEAVVIAKPTDEDGWRRLAMANLAENSKKALTPIDVAWALRRLSFGIETKGGEHGLGEKEAGRRMMGLLGHALSERQVKSYLQLLSFPLDLQGLVHRGEVSMASALKEGSEKGHGRSHGPRPGIKHRDLRKVKPGTLAGLVSRRKPADDRVFTAAEVEQALLAVAGEGEAPDWLPKLLEKAQESVTEAKLKASQERIAAKAKKAPPRRGKGAARANS